MSDYDRINPKAMGKVTNEGVSSASGCAFVPVVSHLTGMDAILDGLRLAKIPLDPPKKP